MKIDRIDLWSSSETDVFHTPVKYVELGLKGSESLPTDSYILEHASGLGTDELTPVVHGGSATENYRRMLMTERTIVFRIRLNPQYSSGEVASELRDDLSKIISSSHSGLIEVQLMLDDATVAFVKGYVTKFEADLFEPRAVVQMTVECTYPLFRSPDYVVINSGFTMPSLTITDDVSTAPHGFELSLDYVATLGTAPADSFRMLHDAAGTLAFQAYGAIDYVADATIEVGSEDENKYFYVDKTGDPDDRQHLIPQLAPSDRLWPTIFPGTNVFKMVRWTGFAWVDMDTGYLDYTQVRYRHHWWGV